MDQEEVIGDTPMLVAENPHIDATNLEEEIQECQNVC
jgi:hypothetical protein